MNLELPVYTKKFSAEKLPVMQMLSKLHWTNIIVTPPHYPLISQMIPGVILCKSFKNSTVRCILMVLQIENLH